MIAALEQGSLASAPVQHAERVLLEFVEVLTLNPNQTADEHVNRLRSAGWTDPQIAEAVYITALFAFFNRVADAFGLEDPGYRDLAAQGKTEGLPQRDMQGQASR